jgi:hypothetical protein
MRSVNARLGIANTLEAANNCITFKAKRLVSESYDCLRIFKVGGISISDFPFDGSDFSNAVN